MKHLLTISLLLAVSLVEAASVRLPVGPFRNDHTDLPIVIKLDDYPEFSPIERTQLGIWLGGKELPAQVDDINGDGTPDELAFLLDIKAGEVLQLKMAAKKHHKSFEKEVHAEMFLKSKTPEEGFTYHEAEGKQFYIKPVSEQSFGPGEDSYHMMHHHGVAFESSLMAYRIYFDKKQTIDVYAKKTPQLELDACKWYPTDEQLAAGFGDDILRVSGHIGVGACKPYNGEKMIHFDDVDLRTERIVAQGTIRTICEIIDKGWKLPNGQKIDVTTRYTLYARHRDVQVEVFYSQPVEHMCTGVQKIGEPNYFSLLPAREAEDGQPSCKTGAIVASWGTAWPVNDTIKYAKETCGLAVYVPELDVKTITQDKNNNLILLQPGTYTKYWLTAVSLKEQNPPCRTDQEFWEFTQKWAEELSE